MAILENLRKFVTLQPIVCAKGAEAISASALLRVSWGGRKDLEAAQARYCMGNCFNRQCKIDGLRKRLEPVVKQNTR